MYLANIKIRNDFRKFRNIVVRKVIDQRAMLIEDENLSRSSQQHSGSPQPRILNDR